LKSIAANEGVLNIFTRKQNKNKKIENIKLLMKWIKSEHKRVNEIEENDFKRRADILAESNEKLANLLSRIEEKVVNNETKMEQLSKILEDKLKSDVREKFSEIEKKFSSILHTIEEVKDSFMSTVVQVSNRVLLLETNYKSLVEEFTDKLSSIESTMKSENDSKISVFQEKINKLEERLKSVGGELCELSGSVDQQFSSNKEFVDSLSEGLNLFANEMSEMRSNCQQNEIQLKIDVKRCFKENLESVKFLGENFSKELKEMYESVESKQNGILGKANEALGIANRSEQELQLLRAIPVRVEYLEANGIKLNELINELTSGQKESNDVIVVLSESAKKVKEALQGVDRRQKETEDNLKSISVKQDMVEKDLSQIDSLSKACNTSIEDINKWQRETNEWIKKSDKRYDKLKRNSDKFGSAEKSVNDSLMTFNRIVNEAKSLGETNKTMIKTLENETNNLKHVISKVEVEVKGQARSISELSTDVKDNTRETNRVANVSNLLQNQQQDLRTRTTVMEGSKGNSGDKGGGNLLSTVASVGLGLVPGVGPLAASLANTLLK
jgi:chromosome segregation ATPase